MNNAELARAIGRLEADNITLKLTASSIETKVDALVNANALAKGGTKMLYKVGAVCSALGGGAAWALEHAGKLFA